MEITVKIAIIDDQKTDREHLKEILLTGISFLKDVSIDIFENAELFLSEFAAGTYDLIFMDIYMGEMNGLEAARLLRKSDGHCLLIFTTSSPDFAIHAFDVQAVHYLLKPIIPDKLESALRVCMHLLNEHAKSIEIISNRVAVSLPLESILYATTFHNAVHIYTTAGLYKSYITFTNFTRLLSDDSRFLLCYKGCIINMDHVRSVDDSDFILSQNQRIPMRKRGNHQIKAAYTNYIFSKCRKLEKND